MLIQRIVVFLLAGVFVSGGAAGERQALGF